MSSLQSKISVWSRFSRRAIDERLSDHQARLGPRTAHSKDPMEWAVTLMKSKMQAFNGVKTPIHEIVAFMHDNRDLHNAAFVCLERIEQEWQRYRWEIRKHPDMQRHFVGLEPDQYQQRQPMDVTSKRPGPRSALLFEMVTLDNITNNPLWNPIKTDLSHPTNLLVMRDKVLGHDTQAAVGLLGNRQLSQEACNHHDAKEPVVDGQLKQQLEAMHQGIIKQLDNVMTKHIQENRRLAAVRRLAIDVGENIFNPTAITNTLERGCKEINAFALPERTATEEIVKQWRFVTEAGAAMLLSIGEDIDRIDSHDALLQTISEWSKNIDLQLSVQLMEMSADDRRTLFEKKYRFAAHHTMARELMSLSMICENVLLRCHGVEHPVVLAVTDVIRVLLSKCQNDLAVLADLSQDLENTRRPLDIQFDTCTKELIQYEQSSLNARILELTVKIMKSNPSAYKAKVMQAMEPGQMLYRLAMQAPRQGVLWNFLEQNVNIITNSNLQEVHSVIDGEELTMTEWMEDYINFIKTELMPALASLRFQSRINPTQVSLTIDTQWYADWFVDKDTWHMFRGELGLGIGSQPGRYDQAMRSFERLFKEALIELPDQEQLQGQNASAASSSQEEEEQKEYQFR